MWSNDLLDELVRRDDHLRDVVREQRGWFGERGTSGRVFFSAFFLYVFQSSEPMSVSRAGRSNAACSMADDGHSLMEVDALSDKMDSISLRSKGSKRSTSTLSSLLSNKSLELVFGLIDEYYVKSERPNERVAPSTAELLGNIAPSTGSSTSPSQGLDALLTTAAGEANPLHELVVRAISVANRDRERLEELVAVLAAAQERASSTPEMPHEQLEQLDADLSEIRNLLRELKGIEQACCVDNLGDPSERHNALAPHLAALAAWQERVLSNALVNRAHMHTRSHRAPAGRVGQGAPTATQFIQGQRPQSPYMAHPHHPYMAHHASHQQGAYLAHPGHAAVPMTSMPPSATAHHHHHHHHHPPQQQPQQPQAPQQQYAQQQYAQYQAQAVPQPYMQGGGAMLHAQIPSMPYAQGFAVPQGVRSAAPGLMMRRHYSLDNKIDLAPSAQAASRKGRSG